MSNILNNSNLESINTVNNLKKNLISFNFNKENEIDTENIDLIKTTSINDNKKIKLENYNDKLKVNLNEVLNEKKNEINTTIQLSKVENINNLSKYESSNLNSSTLQKNLSNLLNNEIENNPIKNNFCSEQSLPSFEFSSSKINQPSTSSKDILNILENANKINNNFQNVSLKETSDTNLKIENLNILKNGDILVSLFPLNLNCDWITPAIFKPELVPEELMNSQLKLTVEDYVNAIQILINDYRFNCYIIFYKRITLVWLTLGFIILFSLLYLNVQGIYMFIGTLIWLLINIFGIVTTFWFKMKLIRNLEKCLARVNEIFYKNNIILAVDDKGKISCHKINLVFIYFDASECIAYLNNTFEQGNEFDSINNTIKNLNQLNKSQSLNLEILQNEIENLDIVITGPTPTRLTQKEKYGEKLFLRYSQRWGKDFVRKRINLNTSLHGDVSNTSQINSLPRHLEKSKCPCQYIEEHLIFKPFYRCNFKEVFC